MSGSTTAYSRLVARVWGDRQSFLLVEHDIELTEEALRHALACGCSWSVNPYKGKNGLFTRSLGCTRFRSSLLEAFPQAMSMANAMNDSGISPPGHWNRLDGRLDHVLRTAGYRPHLHTEVPHHHEYL